MRRCELDICDLKPCQNGGNCTKIHKLDYNCTCVLGFDGHHCSHNINDCINNTCVKNATCIDGVNNYTCQCPNGYSGEFCNIDINECSSNACKNNGTCFNEIGQYKCSCLSGFNGTQCENNIDDCPSHGCNNGTCTDGINSYRCQCYNGFNGSHCEHEINECLDSKYEDSNGDSDKGGILRIVMMWWSWWRCSRIFHVVVTIIPMILHVIINNIIPIDVIDIVVRYSHCRLYHVFICTIIKAKLLIFRFSVSEWSYLYQYSWVI